MQFLWVVTSGGDSAVRGIETAINAELKKTRRFGGDAIINAAEVAGMLGGVRKAFADVAAKASSRPIAK